MPDDERGQSESGQQQGQQGTSGAQTERMDVQGTDVSGLGDAGMRALEREREARKEAERKLKEAQEAAEREKLSEKQRLEKEAQDAKNEADKAKLEAMRFRIGLKAGVPVDHLDRVRGTTEEEIKADAEAYAKSLGQQAGGLGGGARGTEAPKDMNALIRSAAGRGQ
jgi:hypothetical protein